MKFGLSGHSGGLESVSINRIKELIPILEKRGFTSMWMNEEHFRGNQESNSGFSYSPLIFGTMAAALTTQMRIGFTALLLPMHHSLRLAEEIATMDQLSNGRIDFGITRGHPGHYFDAYNVNPDERTELLRNGLDKILSYWTKGTVQIGEMEVNFAPDVYQKPYPPIYVAAYTDESVGWTAKSGYRLLQHGIQSCDNLRRCFHVYRECGGQTKDVPVGRFVYVGETDESARKEIWPTICGLTDRLRKIRTNRFSLIHDESDLEPETFYNELAIIGSPETCAEKLGVLADELDISHYNLLSSFFGLLPADLLEASLERFSSSVIPILQKNN